MADMSKAEKLAAARRKLKEFQQKNKESIVAGPKNSTKKSATKSSDSGERRNSNEQSFVFDSGTGDSSFIETTPANIILPETSRFETESALESQSVPLMSYNSFIKEETNVNSSGISPEDYSNRSTEEVTILPDVKPELVEFQSNASAIRESHPSANNMFTNVFPPSFNSGKDFFDSFSSHSTDIISDSSTAIEDKNDDVFVQSFTMTEKESKEIIESNSQIELKHASNEADTTYQSSSNTNQIDGTVQSQDMHLMSSEEDLKQNYFPSDSPMHEVNRSPVVLSANDQNLNTSFISGDSIKMNSIISNTESLRQLSLQMNGLMDKSVDVSGSSVSELEQRNQELAAIAADRQQKIEQLQLQLKEYQSRVSLLQVDMAQLKTESDGRIARELHPVQEQLQLHIQTVGILVGEKTELQAALTKSQQTAKQKAVEVEELQGRLKASRHKVSELEKEISTVSSVNKQLESTSQEQLKNAERIRLENNMVKKQLDEVEEEASELRQKLNSRSNEYMALQQDLQEKQSQLDLSKLRVQQLSTCDNPDVDSQLEALNQQKLGLERQVVELQQTVKTLGMERDQASQQYQDYLQQFNTQLKNMAEKIAATSAENEQLSNREQSLVRHVSELEKRLQQQQQQAQRVKESPTQQKDAEHLRELENRVSSLEGEKQELYQKLDNILQESTRLQSESEEGSKRIEELEAMIEALQADQPDKNRLLAAMESDKVAAAQAVGQNQKLKLQLEELQDGFIKMSNNKLDLTEHLQREKHVSKELGERLVQQEGELNDLRNRLEEKESQLLQLQKNSSHLSNKLLQHNEKENHMKHEIESHLVELLKQELDQSKAHNQALSLQNGELRTLLAQQSPQKVSSVTNGENTDETNHRKDELVANLSASVQQLEMERDQLLSRLHEVQSKEMVPTHESNSDPGTGDSTAPDSDVNPKDYISMKEAMEKLQQRFTRTMEEIAELSDEKQRLEHLVLQLQGETETIGEYIALYQVQRTMLRKRSLEKDEQLSRLQKDREEMRTKLNELTNLVQRLVTDKNETPIAEIATEETGTVKDHTMQSQGLLNGDIESTATVPEEPDGSLPSAEVVHNHHHLHHHPIPPDDTAGKIMALISEIGSSSLVESQKRNSENFHPCPWCSGRLLTI